MRKSMFDLSIKLEDIPFGGVVLLNGKKDIISWRIVNDNIVRQWKHET